VFPVFCAGYEVPLRATYFRQDLPHVAGSPNLRVLCLIRLPFNLRPLALLQASLLSRQSDTIIEYQRNTVSTLLRVFSISTFSNSIPPGIEWASQVLKYISLYMPQPSDSGGPPHPDQYGCFCVDFGGR
jgi:hypothetical protein